MKIIFKVITNVLILAFISVTVFAYSNQSYYEEFSDEEIEVWGIERLQNLRNANAFLDDFLDMFPTDRTGERLYPDYYGGALNN